MRRFAREGIPWGIDYAEKALKINIIQDILTFAFPVFARKLIKHRYHLRKLHERGRSKTKTSIV